MDWSLTAKFLLFAALQVLTVGQDIHHNLPDNLEIIDPKTLGLSGTDLENFLGNVKLLPIDGGQGGGSGPKTQILTVGFDGNEKLNLDDFASLSTQGLADNDKSVAEMAFKKFQDFFKNPGSAQQFEDQTTPGTSTTYSSSPSNPPSSSSTTGDPSTSYSPSPYDPNNYSNNDPSNYNNNESTEKPKKKRIRVHKRPIFSSTFRSNGDDIGVTSTEATEQYNNNNNNNNDFDGNNNVKPTTYQDYARVIQELQTKTPAPEIPLTTTNQPRNKFPVYHNFPEQKNNNANNNNGGNQNQASTSTQVGFGGNQNYVSPQQQQPETKHNGPIYITTSQPQQQHSPPPELPQQQQQPHYFLRTPTIAHSQHNSVSHQTQQQQNPTPTTPVHFSHPQPQQQPNFPPPPQINFVRLPQPQPLTLGPPELQGFPEFQNELAPLFPAIKFDPPQNLNYMVVHNQPPPPPPRQQHQQQQQQQQQHNFNHVQNFPPQVPQQRQPTPTPLPQPQPQHQQQQQQYLQNQPPIIVTQQPQQHIHVQHITPMKAHFNHEQSTKPTQTQYFPQEARENFVEYKSNNREQKSVGQNIKYQPEAQQQQQQIVQHSPPATTTTPAPTSFSFPIHNRFRSNDNYNNNNQQHQQQQSYNNNNQQHQQQQSYNNNNNDLRPPMTTSRPFDSNGVFQVTPSSGLIPIATVENAMNAYHSQQQRQRYLEKMKQYNPGKSKPSYENINSFNVHTSTSSQPPVPQDNHNEFRHPAPPPPNSNNNNFGQQFNGPPPQQHPPTDGFSNSNMVQNFKQPPPPQSYQQFSRPPLPPPPQRQDFRQPPPPGHFQNNFPQKSQTQDVRQHLPPPRDHHFRGPPPPPPPPLPQGRPFSGPFPNPQNNFIQQSHPVKHVHHHRPRNNNNNFREERVLHRIHINNTNNFREQNGKDHLGFQTSPSTNFRYSHSNQFPPKNQPYFRHPPPLPMPPPNAVYQQTQTHPIPFNLLRPEQPYPHQQQQQQQQREEHQQQPQQQQQLQSASVEIPTINRPPPPTSTVFRFPVSNTRVRDNFIRSTTDHHPEAELYAKSMGLQVHSIKPSPLLTSFRL